MSMAIIAGVVGVAGTAYGAYASSQAADGAPAPVQSNPGADLLKYIKGLKKGLPSLTGLELEYRPQYGQLNINDQTQYLNALLRLGGTATGAAGQQLQDARVQDYANMGTNTPAVMGLLSRINPNGQAAAQRATTMANDAYNRSLSISPQEARLSDQTAREAFAARGRINDNVAVAGELMGREDVMAGKRAEAAALNQNAFDLNSRYSSPALGLLMGTPASSALGQDYLNSSSGIIGQNTPQLINPDAGMNLGMQNAANMNSYNMAQAAAQQNSAAAWGQVGGSLLGLAGKLYTG